MQSLIKFAIISQPRGVVAEILAPDMEEAQLWAFYTFDPKTYYILRFYTSFQGDMYFDYHCISYN